MRALTAFAAATLLLVSAATSTAQEDEYPAQVLSVEATPASVEAGGEIQLRAEIAIDEGWHLYAVSTPGAPEFRPPDGGWPAGITAGAPRAAQEPTKSGALLVHEKALTLTLPLRVAADAAPGKRSIAGRVVLMACDATSCRLPYDHEFSVDVDVTAAVAKPVTVSAAFTPDEAAAGGEAVLRIEMTIAPGWHVYGLATDAAYKPPSFVWTTPPGLDAGVLEEVTPAHKAVLGDKEFLVHEGKAVLHQRFRVGKDVAPGTSEIRGLGTWQRCDAGSCTDDKDVPVTATLRVVPAGTATAAPPPRQETSGEGLTLGLLGKAIFWGFITVLTPCVFPLLPVTVSFFSKQQGPPLPRAFVYSAGIIFTITGIGLVFQTGLDTFARGDAFNLFVGAMFLVLALSLFGLFDLRLPSFLIDKSTERSGRGGQVGVFFMGTTLALTSFSCSMPFLALMFEQFRGGGYAAAIVGLLVYSATVAAPFFVCSMFPSLLQSLPRAGAWLNAVKVTMGFVEFGLAFKFLRTVALNHGSDILSRDIVLAIWIACAAGATLYLFGYLTLPHDTKVQSIGVIRLMFALGFLTFSLYLVPGLFGKELASWLEGFIQTQRRELAAATIGKGEGHEIPWVRDDWDGALARAAAPRPVLFDFTGFG